jgi:serine/threonine protein kinase
VSQLCDALAVAHDRGIVHRDLKPENVVLQQVNGQDLLKVLDFGLAKPVDADGTDDVSQTGEVVGTMGYISPEQLSGRAVDQRTDVFAVGVMAWEALCGVKPFHGSTVADLAIAMHEPPPTPPALVPKAVRSILTRAIAYDPGHRPATALALRQELVPALRHQ